MKLLVCFDGSIKSYQAVEEAKKLAQTFEEKEITLIHVYPEKEASYWDAINQKKATEPPKGLSDSERSQVEKFMRIKKMAREVVEEFSGSNINVDKRIIKGDPVSKITEIAEKEKFDMIVIGNRGLGGLKKMMLGSISNGVIQQSKVNVLVVK